MSEFARASEVEIVRSVLVRLWSCSERLDPASKQVYYTYINKLSRKEISVLNLFLLESEFMNLNCKAYKLKYFTIVLLVLLIEGLACH